MTLLSTYDPSSEAKCPKCNKLVKCENLGGITFGGNPYLDFWHAECDTEWRLYLNSNEIVTPIPVPMTMREMMGEDNWAKQKEKERVQAAAFQMLYALEAILAGNDDGLEQAEAAVAKARGT